MKTTPICVLFLRIFASFYHMCRVSWRVASMRWFPFKDVPDWYVQAWALWGKDSDQSIHALAAEEWALRRRRRNRNRESYYKVW